MEYLDVAITERALEPVLHELEKADPPSRNGDADG